MAELTPMLKQYQAIKEKHQNELLFFRLGDFYELFGEDAKEASRILNIVLTARHKGTAHETPMCGIPYHALNNYLSKLIKAGKRVAICEQLSDPTLPGIVKREVIRVITPGTTLDEAGLNDKNNNYIVSLVCHKNYWGLAVADLTTGEFKMMETGDQDILKSELFRLSPAEVIIPTILANEEKNQKFFQTLRNVNTYNLSAFDDPYRILTTHFQTKNLQSFGVENLRLGIEAAGILLAYLKETQKTDLKHISKVLRYTSGTYMVLDEATIRNLELFNTSFTGEYRGSLLSVLDKTLTNLGGRMLRRWLLLPLLNEDEINYRQEAVKEFLSQSNVASDVREQIKNIADLERLIGRIGCNKANPRDLVGLRMSLENIPRIKNILTGCTSKRLQNVSTELGDHKILTEYLNQSILDEPSALLSDGGIIKDGYNEQLDELRQISKGGKDWLLNYQAQEIERTKINTLKVRFNRIFGYYIEITNSNLNQVPEDYTRKQTLVNGERFTTPELKEYEEKILGAEERIIKLEQQIFVEVLEKVTQHFVEIQKAADAVAELDVLLNFAQIAGEYNYVCPEINSNGVIDIKNGRHPVIERFISEPYVPNDLELNHEKNEFILLTGPNMSGKSSFLRQAALISLLMQMGSFVPAEKANLCVVDRIFTRVGASDNLSQGVSTFMAEMQEAANILNNATRDSLIILDELGRGTSTYDGVSIAWSIIEYIHNHLGAKTLFATHYHELTEVIAKLERTENYCVAVSENDGRVVFLHKILKGASSESYGIEVARLAGLPEELIDRAKEILLSLEKKIAIKAPNQALQGSLPLQLNSKEQAVVRKIGELNIDELTPLEALQKMAELKEKL
ncbi:MAG: mismatch repair protein MutS protein [Parcubacteria group bacterium GW2011_GWC2_39_14]|nr:MAG: mismatch repair protein MutS protein [Parcubacteria group bacterium GW2011_GWC2_39_14]KKR53588.1 MAG: mismatch repair protein MutS protein [Parcubacteria group bacterium GW2011_GWA2_40_23]